MKIIYFDVNTKVSPARYTVTLRRPKQDVVKLELSSIKYNTMLVTKTICGTGYRYSF